MFDPDPLVRVVVAERLPAPRLGAMLQDEDLRVRFTIAERAPLELAAALADDPDELVREAARARLAAAPAPTEADMLPKSAEGLPRD